MSVWVVVGGQYGSEGKGKISAFITQNEQIDICVRCGGPNSGHSFVASSGETVLVRQLPTGFVRTNTRLLIPAGAYVDLRTLREEVSRLGLDRCRVGVDRNAVIISEDDQRYELDLGLRDALSSTLSGVGSAVARRAMRINVETIGMRARTDGWLRPFVCHVAEEVNAAASLGKKILIEGTQGFGLSVFHSSEFPKATSRDTTAAGFLSEVGVSPLLVSEIVMVLRTFPIRVAGIQAGTLKNETTWEALERESKYPHSIAEFTSVTKKLRRVARFDWELASEAVRYNRPTRLAINGLDYLDFDNYRVTSVSKLSGKAMSFLNDVASRLLVPIGYYGTSPYLDDVIAPATAPQSYAWGSPDDRHFTSVD